MVPVLAGLLVALGAACSNASGTGGRIASTETPGTALPGTALPGTAPGTQTPGTAPATETDFVPVEPTGVPGLDAVDPFCGAWSVYGGSLQIISVASAFSDLDQRAITLIELASAPSIVDAVERIDENWPASLVAEHDLALDDLLGPYERRAERAVAALRASGLSDADLVVLSDVWREVLRSRDSTEPAVTLPDMAPAIRGRLDAAASSFDAVATPFDHDPSLLIEGVEVPLTSAYLARSCPDVASSGVGDSL